MAEKSTKVLSNLNKFFNISNNKVEQKKTICRINLPTVKEDKEQSHFTWFKIGENSKKVADELKWTITDINENEVCFQVPANLGAHPTSIFIGALSRLYRNAKTKSKSAKKDVPENVKQGRRLPQHKLRKMLEMEIKRIDKG